MDHLHFPKTDWLKSYMDQGLRRYTDWKTSDPKYSNWIFRRNDKYWRRRGSFLRRDIDSSEASRSQGGRSFSFSSLREQSTTSSFSNLRRHSMKKNIDQLAWNQMHALCSKFIPADYASREKYAHHPARYTRRNLRYGHCKSCHSRRSDPAPTWKVTC